MNEVSSTSIDYLGDIASGIFVDKLSVAKLGERIRT